MAVKIACQIADFIRNTGSNSALLPEPPVMILLMDKSFRFSLADLGEDPVAFFEEKYHALGKDKVFPIFGNAAPVDFLANNDTQDTIITTDSGKQVFVRYGFMIKNLGSLSGGLCLAKALQSLNNASLAAIEISASGRMVAGQYSDTSFGGISVTVFAPKPTSADFNNPARNNLQIQYNPTDYVQKAKILTSDEMIGLLDTMGLIDLKMTVRGVNASTTTTLKFRIIDECCNDDVAADLPDEFLDEANFVVRDEEDNSVKTITDVTVSGDTVTLTAAASTFTSGHTYSVTVVGTNELFAAGVEGYEIADTLSITIP